MSRLVFLLDFLRFFVGILVVCVETGLNPYEDDQKEDFFKLKYPFCVQKGSVKKETQHVLFIAFAANKNKLKLIEIYCYLFSFFSQISTNFKVIATKRRSTSQTKLFNVIWNLQFSIAGRKKSSTTSIQVNEKKNFFSAPPTLKYK